MESFGIVPAVLLGSVLYAAYHPGYGMEVGEKLFLFFVGMMFSVVFLIMRSVLI